MWGQFGEGVMLSPFLSVVLSPLHYLGVPWAQGDSYTSSCTLLQSLLQKLSMPAQGIAVPRRRP